ncbi:MAG: zinc finger Ran-binding domain-containing protein [Pyrinomonadaceae bacterium]
MRKRKCTKCGLVNFASAEECSRCAAALPPVQEDAGQSIPEHESGAHETDDEPTTAAPRSLIQRALIVLGLTAFILLLCYVSLLETSAPATFEQRETVRRAIAEIERAGFVKDAFLLRHLVNYRTSDNWWNRWAGHDDAYAATNFPFEVVTLYPDFFAYPQDDTERAVILLHEARHLSGAGEEKAFESVWRDKARLGWTAEKYAQTRVWKNVNEFTRRLSPKLFKCGTDNGQDCLE